MVLDGLLGMMRINEACQRAYQDVEVSIALEPDRSGVDL